MRTSPAPVPNADVRKNILQDRPWEIYLVAMLLLIMAAWLLPLRRSLWLDETGTYWTIKDGFQETVRRALQYQGQSPLYYTIAWLALAVGGRSEMMLRLPSTVAAAGAALLLYRLGRRFVDRPTGLVAAIAFVALQGVAFAATNARPYAIALLFVVGAVLALVRWLEHGRLIDGISYVALAALTVYAHYLFAVMFLVHAVYAFWPRPPESRVSRRMFCAAIGVAAVLTLPLAPQLLSLTRRTSTLSFLPRPTPVDLLRALMPIAVLLAVLLVRRRSAERMPTARPAELALVVAWSSLAPTLLFLASWLTPARLFLGRYFLEALPGTALLIGCAIRSIRSARSRVVIMTAFVALLLVRWAEPGDDWRSAAAAVRSVRGHSDVPVLVWSGLVESRQIEWLQDKERSSYVLAPLAFYPVGGPAVPLPWSEEGGGSEYLEELAKGALKGHERFIAITGTKMESRRWFGRRMEALGFTARNVATFGELSVDVFERRAG